MTGFDSQAAYRWLSRYIELPGLVQIYSLPDKVSKCFPTTEDGICTAVDYAAKLDRHAPVGVYYRLSTLTERPQPGRRGGAALTAAVPAIVSDLDIFGPGHSRTDLPPDEASARSLVADAGLPDPTDWHHSGGGLYAIWRLERPVDRVLAEELGRRVNEALTRAAQTHGWHVDTVSADTARVFRLPGSRNLKASDNPSPCMVLEQRTGARVNPTEFPVCPADPEPTPTLRRRPPPPRDGVSPGDAFAEAVSWSDLLEPVGWELVRTEPSGAELWRRPGANSEYSARAFAHNIVVHSEAADLPSGAGQRLTRLRLFAELHHGGDASAAIKDLIAASRGEVCNEAAAALPDEVLAAVRAAAPSDQRQLGGLKLTRINETSNASTTGISDTTEEPQVGATKYESNELNEVTKLILGPIPHPATFYGLLGEVVHGLEPATEAAPVAMLGQLVAYSGAFLRDRAFTPVGGSTHPPRVWPLIIGKTSAGRKGESRAQVRVFVARALSDEPGNNFVTSFSSFDSSFVQEHSGLSTGEGLLSSLAEKVGGEGGGPAKWVPLNDAVVVTETEFARTLAAGKRENNTLTAILRDLWDAGRGQVMTKAEPIKVSGAFLVVIAHVTPRELRLKLSEADVAGGLMNRFLCIYSHRSKLLADQPDVPDTRDLQRRFKAAIDWSRNLKAQPVTRTEAANRYWRRIYRALAEQEPDGLLGELLARAPAYTLRLALVYALMDRCTRIRVAHLRAALALVDYSIRSTLYVFGGNGDTGDLGKLAEALRKAGGAGLTRSDVSGLFSRNREKAEVDALVAELVADGHVAETTQETGQRGRPTVRLVWTGPKEPVNPLTELLDLAIDEQDEPETYESNEENHARRTPAGESRPSNVVRPLRPNREQGNCSRCGRLFGEVVVKVTDADMCVSCWTTTDAPA